MPPQQRYRLSIVLLTVFASGISSPASAQAEAPRVDVWAGITVGTLASTDTFVSNYSPPLLLDGDFTSHAGQTISLTTNRGAGVSGGIDLFPWRHAGIQMLVDRARYEVSGTSSAYAFALQYTSLLPPANQPQRVAVDDSQPWPAVTGSFTELRLALNVVARLGDARRVALAISAGPTLMRSTGEIEPLGYTTFHLGGHSVLFKDDYRVGASLGTTWSVGVNAGGELSLAVGSHTAVVIAARYWRGETSVPVRVDRVLNPADITFAQSIDEVATAFGSPGLRRTIAGPRVLVALKVTP